jgi:hypothetical protein
MLTAKTGKKHEHTNDLSHTTCDHNLIMQITAAVKQMIAMPENADKIYRCKVTAEP